MLSKAPFTLVLMSGILVFSQPQSSLSRARDATKTSESVAPRTNSVKSDSRESDSEQPDSAKQGSSEAESAKADSAKQDYSKQAFVIDRLYTLITEQSDGTGTRERTAEIKILSQAGLKALAVLSFPYTSDNESLEFDYVRVRKPDGTVVKTPEYNIQDMPAEVSRVAPLYSDVHEKHVAVKGLEIGDVLEYVMRVRVSKAQVSGQFWYEDSFTKNAVVRDQRLEINVPADKYVKVVCPEFKPEVTSGNGRKIYRWTRTNLGVKEKDPDEIPRRTLPTPDVQVTTFASWQDVGRWYAGLQKSPLEVTPAIQAKAAELTKGLQTDDEKIHALYNFVSLKYHYVGLDFGIGRYQPHAADDVLGNGYGDCKDKHTLLASLLKAAGYEAWPALINGSRMLDPDSPSPAQFNHVITVVPRNGKYTWLDTTPEVAPYGLILQQLRNKQALVIPTNEPARLMTTPENPLEPQRQEFSMEGRLDSEGTFTGHAELIHEGDTALLFRVAFRQTSESEWTELVQRISRGMNFGGDVSNVKVTPPDDIDKPFMISYDYVRKDFADWENHHTNAALPPMGVEVYKDAKDLKPPEPFLLGALGTLKYRARVTLPKNYQLVLPTPVHLTESFADYNSVTNVEDGVMTTVRELKIKETEVPLTDWERYRAFGIAIATDEFNYMPLNGPGAAESADLGQAYRKAMEAMQRHDVVRAETLLQKIISDSPNYPTAHLNLGIALMTDGKTADGMAEFHKEQEVSPKDQRAYQMAAMFMLRAGRFDDAVGEWRRLMTVDPNNSVALHNMVVLLESKGRFSDATQEVEKAAKASPENPDLQMALGGEYLKTDQNEKAVASLRRAVELKSNDAMMLNNAAYSLAEKRVSLDLAQQYATQAVQKVEEQSADENASPEARLQATYQLSLVWDTLGWVYFQNDDLPHAESFVRAAWVLGQEGVVGEHLGDIYQKEHKNQAAAEQYKLALAATGTSFDGRHLNDVVGAPLPMPEEFIRREALGKEITARYQKLTGKKPEINETWRLPNGEWTKTSGEQLAQMRTAKFGKQGSLSGSADFQVLFARGGVENVDYVSGPEALKRLGEKIKTAHYAVQFPDGSQAKILRRAALNCSTISGCMAVLLPPQAGNTNQNEVQ